MPYIKLMDHNNIIDDKKNNNSFKKFLFNYIFNDNTYIYFYSNE